LDIDHVTGLFAQTVSRQRNHSHMLWKVLNFTVWANSSKVGIPEKVVG
jgi:hypothetical protein